MSAIEWPLELNQRPTPGGGGVWSGRQRLTPGDEGRRYVGKGRVAPTPHRGAEANAPGLHRVEYIL